MKLKLYEICVWIGTLSLSAVFGAAVPLVLPVMLPVMFGTGLPLLLRL